MAEDAEVVGGNLLNKPASESTAAYAQTGDKTKSWIERPGKGQTRSVKWFDRCLGGH